MLFVDENRRFVHDAVRRREAIEWVLFVARQPLRHRGGIQRERIDARYLLQHRSHRRPTIIRHALCGMTPAREHYNFSVRIYIERTLLNVFSLRSVTEALIAIGP